MKVRWVAHREHSSYYRWYAEARVNGRLLCAFGDTRWGAKWRLRRKVRRYVRPRSSNGEWTL